MDLWLVRLLYIFAHARTHVRTHTFIYNFDVIRNMYLFVLDYLSNLCVNHNVFGILLYNNRFLYLNRVVLG